MFRSLLGQTIRLLLLTSPLGSLAEAADSTGVISHPKVPCGVSGILEAAAGGLYIVCDTGFYRFDGLRYLPVTGYPFRSAGVIRATDDGAIWIASTEEGLARYDQRTGQFQVVATGPIDDPSAVGSLVFVKRSGEARIRVYDSASIKDPVREFPFADIGLVHVPWLTSHAWIANAKGAYRVDKKSLFVEKVSGLPASFRQAIPDGQGRVWTTDATGVRAWKDGAIVGQHATASAEPKPYLVAGRNGRVWMQADSSIRGLSPPVSLPAISRNGVVRLYEDSRGHVWAASSTGELWELIPPAMGPQWPTRDFAGANPVQLLRTRDAALTLVADRQLYRWNERDNRWQPAPGEPRSYRYVLPMPDGTLLASVDDAGVLRLDADGKFLGRIKGSDTKFLIREFRKLAILPGSGGSVAVGSRHAYFEYSAGSDGLRLVPTPEIDNPGRKLAVAEDYPSAVDFETAPDGRFWMAYTKGLAWWDTDGKAWRKLPVLPGLTKLRSLAVGANGDLWVSRRLRGAFYRVRDGKAEEFRAADGYFPDDTDFLKVDRRGWIWRGTERGVWVSDGKNVGAADWIFLEASGECAQYGFFEDGDGSVWIAGDRGVTHLSPDPAWFRKLPGAPPAPKVRVDGQLLLDGWPDSVKEQPKSIQFDFAPVPRGGSPNGVLYSGAVQYRLLPRHQDWRWSDTRRFEYADLAPGSYRLEVRQAGYLQPFVRELRIGIVPWFRGWMLLLPLAGIAAWLYKQREKVRYRLGWAWFLLRRWKSRRYWDAERQDLSGRAIKGRYRLVRLASTGGFSQVYEAIDQERDGTTVAVKMLFHRSSDAGWVRDRFTQEVSALQLIDHPGVVALTDFWIQPEGEPCLAMTFLDGPTLRETLVSGNPWPLPKVAQFVKSLGETLAFVHQAGVLHRDLKPENIVLHDGRPTVVDFGSSGLLGRNEPAGVTRLLTGSIEYLAPERLTGHYSTASDIYSLGAIAFELLTGEQLATSGVAIYGPNLAEALREALPASCREDVATVLAESLRPVPEQRPQDAADWATRLADAIERSA